MQSNLSMISFYWRVLVISQIPSTSQVSFITKHVRHYCILFQTRLSTSSRFEIILSLDYLKNSYFIQTINVLTSGIAERTLDIYTAAVLAEKFVTHVDPKPMWRARMDALSESSCDAYRTAITVSLFLIDQHLWIEYFDYSFITFIIFSSHLLFFHHIYYFFIMFLWPVRKKNLWNISDQRHLSWSLVAWILAAGLPRGILQEASSH